MISAGDGQAFSRFFVIIENAVKRLLLIAHQAFQDARGLPDEGGRGGLFCLLGNFIPVRNQAVNLGLDVAFLRVLGLGAEYQTHVVRAQPSRQQAHGLFVLYAL